MQEQHINAAYRLHEILRRAAQQKDDEKTHKVWAATLGIEEENQHRRVAEISSALSLMHSEVEVLRAQMQQTEFSEPLYEPYLRKAESAISSQSLSSQWRGFKQYITPDVLLSLKWCSEALPSDEELIAQEEWQSLVNEVNGLEEQLEAADLPPSIKALIAKHIDLIRKALRSYGIVGVKAIKEAVHRAAGELIEHKELIQQHKDSEEVSRFGRIWQRTSQIADGVLKVDKVLKAGGRVWALIKPIFDSGS